MTAEHQAGGSVSQWLGDIRLRARWGWRDFSEKTYVRIGLWIARHLPRWVRYWVTIDSISRATTGEYDNTVVPELRAMDVLNRI